VLWVSERRKKKDRPSVNKYLMGLNLFDKENLISFIIENY